MDGCSGTCGLLESCYGGGKDLFRVEIGISGGWDMRIRYIYIYLYKPSSSSSSLELDTIRNGAMFSWILSWNMSINWSFVTSYDNQAVLSWFDVPWNALTYLQYSIYAVDGKQLERLFLMSRALSRPCLSLSRSEMQRPRSAHQNPSP